MTVVRKFHPEVRLKQLLQEAGGVTAHTALERAEGNLDAIREQSLSAVDAKIEALSAMARTAQQPGPDIYKLANEIFAEAGAFGLVELSAAAHSLCSLMAAAESRSAPRAAIRGNRAPPPPLRPNPPRVARCRNCVRRRRRRAAAR